MEKKSGKSREKKRNNGENQPSSIPDYSEGLSQEQLGSIRLFNTSLIYTHYTQSKGKSLHLHPCLQSSHSVRLQGFQSESIIFIWRNMFLTEQFHQGYNLTIDMSLHLTNPVNFRQLMAAIFLRMRLPQDDVVARHPQSVGSPPLSPSSTLVLGTRLTQQQSQEPQHHEPPMTRVEEGD